MHLLQAGALDSRKQGKHGAADLLPGRLIGHWTDQLLPSRHVPRVRRGQIGSPADGFVWRGV
jgi:hypothetical protein